MGMDRNKRVILIAVSMFIAVMVGVVIWWIINQPVINLVNIVL